MAILSSTPEIAAASGRFPWALRARVSVLVLSTMLAGCTVGSAFKRPIGEVPPGWSSWQGGDASLSEAEMRGNQAPVPKLFAAGGQAACAPVKKRRSPERLHLKRITNS